MLKGKVCIVTGGTRGIGQAIAKLFSLNNAIVIITGRNSNNATWINKWNRVYATNIEFLCFDITDECATTRALNDIRKKYGKLDVLINNAAVEYNENIGMISKKHMQEMLDINVGGTINVLQLASRLMARNQNGGAIINIASVVGIQGNPGQLVYSATKGAIIALTKTAAKELAKNKIRVNAIAPGLTRTDMIQKTSTIYLENRIQKVALKRIAEPEEIAEACLFIASDKASYITGQVLSVDGCSSL